MGGGDLEFKSKYSLKIGQQATIRIYNDPEQDLILTVFPICACHQIFQIYCAKWPVILTACLLKPIAVMKDHFFILRLILDLL